ncbi:MAG TPA: AAA family ATPase [Nostocaceae cyanobacterium]|nr:AAA family ATPase [Nostocaceae cyanobacterium]
MKIKFSNLGTIKETELDLRPLTVIIGPNNSNKTYIAYSVYGLWQLASVIPSLDSKEVDKLGFKKREKDSWSLTIDDNLLDFFIKNIEETAKKFQGRALESFFQDSSRKLFSNTSFKFLISRQEVEKSINELIQGKIFPLTDRINLKLHRQDNIIIFEFIPINDEESKTGTFTEAIFIKHIKQKPEIWFIRGVKQILFSKIFLLPAERNAFINTYKILAYRRYKILKNTQRELFASSNYEKEIDFIKAEGDIHYPHPVEDFLDFLTEVELQETTKIISIGNNEFWNLANKIEKEIQNSNKVKLNYTRLGGKEIKIEVNENLEIDLYNASSSIKQLAPLLLYLRFRASKGDFLVIDEPEMNLHPESQAKLLEALSILVNLGVRVLLTTHSPYIMSHLNNLVNGNHENPEMLERQSLSLYLKDKRAFLPIDQVSAYEMKDNKLVSLNDPDYGIRWDTLSDVSVDIQQKYFEIYEAGQEQTEEVEETDE